MAARYQLSWIQMGKRHSVTFAFLERAIDAFLNKVNEEARFGGVDNPPVSRARLRYLGPNGERTPEMRGSNEAAC